MTRLRNARKCSALRMFPGTASCRISSGMAMYTDIKLSRSSQYQDWPWWGQWCDSNWPHAVLFRQLNKIRHLSQACDILLPIFPFLRLWFCSKVTQISLRTLNVIAISKKSVKPWKSVRKLIETAVAGVECGATQIDAHGIDADIVLAQIAQIIQGFKQTDVVSFIKYNDGVFVKVSGN